MNAPEQLQAVAETGLFITIPETTLPNGTVVPSFQVGKYACSRSNDGKAIVVADRQPWVEINFTEAREACTTAGFNLLTESQALTIAHDIVQQDINWTGGKIGEGKVFMGLHKWNVEEAQAGDYESEDPDERRWHQLSTGERIYDFSGNVYTWIFDDVQGDENGLTGNIAETSPTLTTAPYPSMEKGMGWRPDGVRDWSGLALIRGGYWLSGSLAGVFRLGGGWPVRRLDRVGFRCTK